MNFGGVISCSLLLLFLPRQAICQDTYDIPVTINALIQDSVKIDKTAKLFYNMDKNFYSKVTVTDAAINAQQRVRDTMKKTIKVVFFTVASSHVSKTLTLSNLLYTTKSKWSYTVEVKSILEASQGELPTINDKTVIYKIQENAMKVLEERFQFQSSKILSRLNLESMEDYYAVDENKWIKVVGIIVENVIANRSNMLHLTTCYLAEMVDKTVAQIQGFTLNEVDMYIYNTTMLLETLPEYRDNVTTRLYETFDITPTDLARMSNTDLSEINNMILNDVLTLFTNSVLKNLRVTANEIIERDSSFDSKMLLSCTDKWQPFLTIIIPESFDNSAEAMALEVETLSNLIDIPYSEIQQLTITEMINLLETTIDPLSAEKKLVEATKISSILTLHGSDTIDNKKDNVFEVIYRFTNFTERQLTTLYGWTSADYLFSSMFTLDEANNVCTIDSLDYDLLAMAKLTVGQVVGDIQQCQSFTVLREIWDRNNVNFLENKYSSGEQLPLDTPISMMVSQLTKAPSTINYRVLNITTEAEELISKLSINNITAVTTYQSPHLKTLSFQDIIGIIVHLKHNGSFDHQVVSHFILTSLTPSLMLTPTQYIYTTNYPTSTRQKSHATTAMFNISHDSDKHATVPISRNPLLRSSSNLLDLTSTFHMPQNTFMQIPNQINTTITPQRTSTASTTHQSPSLPTKKYLSPESISDSQSKILPTLRFNNITSSYNSTTLKHTLVDSNILNYSKSTTEQIHSTYHVSTYHINSTTMSHPISSSVSLDRNSYIKTIQNVSFAKSTAPLLITSSLSASYSSNESNLTNINRTKSKEHFIGYTSTSHSHIISSNKDLNISKTVIGQGYYQTSISSTRTVRIMTEQTVTVSRNIVNNVTEVYTSTGIKPSTVINVTFSHRPNHLTESEMNTFTPRLYSSYNLSTYVPQTKDHSVPTSERPSTETKMSLLPSVGQQSLNITLSETQVFHSIDSSFNTDRKKTSPSTQNLLTETIGSTKTEVTSFKPKPNLTTTTTSDTTFSVTTHNTISYTTSTKVIVNTTISSPAMAGIDASSKGAFSSRANNSSPNMISLVIQTTRIESTMLTSAQTSTPLVMPLLPTTTIAIPEKMTSSEKASRKTEVSSMIEASSTMNVLPTNTVISTQEPPMEKPSTNLNHPTSTITAVVKPSLNTNSHATTSINVPHVQTSSPYLSVALPTLPIMSQPTKVSTTSLATSMTSLVKPSTTISGASSSSIQKPGKVKIMKKMNSMTCWYNIIIFYFFFFFFLHPALTPSDPELAALILSLHPSVFLVMSTVSSLIFKSSFTQFISLRSSSSSVPFHLQVQNTSDWLSLISSYYVSMCSCHLSITSFTYHPTPSPDSSFLVLAFKIHLNMIIFNL